MQIPASSNHQVQALLPSKRLPSRDGSPAQLEKTQHITTSLSNKAPLSGNYNNQQTIYNSVNAVSMLQVANDGLDEIHDGLNELQNLHTLALKIPGHASQQVELQAQADDIVAGIQDIIESTKFNGQSLLSESSQHTVMTDKVAENALTVETHNLDSELANIGLYSLKIGNHNATQANQSINDSMSFIDQLHHSYNRQQMRLNTEANNLFSQQLINNSKQPPLSLTATMQSLTNNPQALIQSQANINAEKSINLLTR